MAIRKRDKCTEHPYQVYWTNPFTKKRESVFCETLQEAQKTDAMIKYRLAWEKDSFRPSEQQTKEDVSNNTLGGIIYAYLREKQMSKDTLRSTLTRLRQADEMLGRKDIEEITAGDLGRLMIEITASGIKPVQVRARMRTLHTVFLWAMRRHLLAELPEWPEPPRGTYEHFVPPTQEEIALMLEAAPPHLQRVIIMASRFGCRVGSSELLKLRWQDVDWSRNVLCIHAAKKNLSEPVREVPIRQELIPLLRRWHADDMTIGTDLICHYQGKAYSRLYVSWRTMLRNAGITRRIRPYDLRHAFATELIAAGADLGTVAKLMGHSDVQTVLRHYQHVMTSQKVAAIEALPDLPMCHSLCATEQTTLIQ